MKKLFVPFLFLSCAMVVYAGDDKKVISEIIDNEYQAYTDKNIDAWAGYWLQEPSVNALYAWKSGYQYIETYDSLYANVKKWMSEENMEGTGLKKEIQNIYISGDIATVYLNEHNSWKMAGEEHPFTLKSTYTLKKVNGNWKFLSMSTINATTYENNDYITEWSINMEGYKLLSRGETEKAIEVFKLNTQLYPDAFNTWDSLAEAYMVKGDNDMAVKYYNKSLAINDKNNNAKEMLEKIKGN